MSYPNPNPYGPPPGQQPGYGYPQQQPPSPYGAYPGGGMMPGAPAPYPTVMPGGVKAARVMLFVLAGLNLIGLIFAVMGLGSVSKASKNASEYTTSDAMTAMNVGKGLLIAVIVVIVLFIGAAIMLGAQFGNGGSGVRVGTIIFGVANTLVSLLSFPFGLVHTVLGILIIVFVSKDDGTAWFNRPRY
ncbi:hypothetical protein FCH28_17780 [Streptomyces piniterrae]|uniref:Uncharacterized protein n=1 Tax=Streptomyces piniterrae TaxID=2571125 RepID=A0A4U0NFX2_9ACTN|nr:hypothetical protein [Streptomyces piniterrae]TJZ53009.1 hypothetical protein FCH28_17780 [Streptomyces piniterrae]